MIDGIKDLSHGLTLGMLAEAGFEDDDFVSLNVNGRVITIEKYIQDDAESLAVEIPADLFEKWLDQEGNEVIHVAIEDKKITLSPMSEDNYLIWLVFGRLHRHGETEKWDREDSMPSSSYYSANAR